MIIEELKKYLRNLIINSTTDNDKMFALTILEKIIYMEAKLEEQK